MTRNMRALLIALLEDRTHCNKAVVAMATCWRRSPERSRQEPAPTRAGIVQPWSKGVAGRGEISPQNPLQATR